MKGPIEWPDHSLKGQRDFHLHRDFITAKDGINALKAAAAFWGRDEGGGQKGGGLTDADDGQSRTCLLAKSQRRRQTEMGKTEAADETKLRLLSFGTGCVKLSPHAHVGFHRLAIFRFGISAVKSCNKVLA